MATKVFAVKIVLFLNVISPKADDPLQNIDWKTQNPQDYPKPWIKYVEAFISKLKFYKICTKSNLSLVKLNMIKILQVMCQELFLERLVRHGWISKHDMAYTIPDYRVVTFPLYLLERRAAIDIYFYYTPVYIEEQIAFKLPTTLRLKIIFMRLVIYHRYMKNKCTNKITVKTRKMFTFCGFYNNFRFYSLGNKLL